MGALFGTISVLLTLTCLAVREVTSEQKDEGDGSDEINILWDDDYEHPRRLEPEPVDYVEKTIDVADQVAALVGGFEGAANVTSFLHDEVSEILGYTSPEQEERKKQRNLRLQTFLPLFDTSGGSKQNSKEEYSWDLGTGKEKTHTAKDMVIDAFANLVDYVRSRPRMRAFDDEL